MNEPSPAIVHKILAGFLLFLLTILMNTLLRPDSSKVQPITYSVPTETKTYVRKEPSKSNFSNNQKAAMFLAFPLGGMIWLASYTLIKNRKKITHATKSKLERESRVVF